MTPTLAGRLLVATPRLSDGIFDLAVVLLLEHGDDGALGVVLNRPSELSLVAALPDWVEAAAEPAVVFAGGPVEREALIALGRPDAVGSGPLVLGLHSVDLDDQPDDLVSAGIGEVRVFAGYAGWSPGQLDGELAVGAWWALDAEPDDVFCADPEALWARVLRRAGGDLALYAHYPEDASAN
jgi:putative transcriptional regulator